MSEFIEKIIAADTADCDLYVQDIQEIRNAAMEKSSGYELFEAIVLAYKYGVMRGKGKVQNKRRKTA